MQDYLCYNATEQLRYVWGKAVVGAPDHTKQAIGEVLGLFAHAVQQRSGPAASLETVRDYMESARIAAQRSDSLGVVLALVAALQELESR